MTHSEAKLKINSDKACPFLQTFLNKKCIRQMFTYKLTDFAISFV
jgi:hypothetical protein